MRVDHLYVLVIAIVSTLARPPLCRNVSETRAKLRDSAEDFDSFTEKFHRTYEVSSAEFSRRHLWFQVGEKRRERWRKLADKRYFLLFYTFQRAWKRTTVTSLKTTPTYLRVKVFNDGKVGLSVIIDENVTFKQIIRKYGGWSTVCASCWCFITSQSPHLSGLSGNIVIFFAL